MRSRDQGTLDAPILSHSTNQARRGSRKRPDPPGLGKGGAGPAANSNNNVRGDMPFDEPFGERLQRSSQLAVVLLGHRHCQGRAPHSLATIEARRAPHSITRLQQKSQAH